MKILLYVGVLVVTAPLTFAQTKSGGVAPASPVEQEIINLERARLRAFAQDDKATFEKLVTDDLTVTHSSGNVSSKVELMAVMRPSTPDRPLPTLSIEDAKVRVYGGAAVMTGNLVETARDGRRELVLRFTRSSLINTRVGVAG